MELHRQHIELQRRQTELIEQLKADVSQHEEIHRRSKAIIDTLRYDLSRVQITSGANRRAIQLIEAQQRQHSYRLKAVEYRLKAVEDKVKAVEDKVKAVEDKKMKKKMKKKISKRRALLKQHGQLTSGLVLLRSGGVAAPTAWPLLRASRVGVQAGGCRES